jgi:DNA-binding NtrC family response regulator
MNLKFDEESDETHQAGSELRQSVIVVEDEETFRSLLARALERRGYAVSQFSDAADAWRSLESSSTFPYALITDSHMPSMNGGELLQRIIEKKLSIPILILMSSNSPIWTGVLRNDDGIFQLEKPFAIEQLVEILQRIETA